MIKLKSFVHAISGFVQLVKTEFHFKVHIIISILVICLGFYSGISMNHWLWLSTAILFVLISEGFNTVIEKVCDLIDEKQNQKIKFIKDASAGIVLLSVINAVFVGISIFFL